MSALIVFGIALLLRLVYFFQIKSNDPMFFYPIMDALYHHNWAISINTGGWLGSDAFFRAPLYPYFLALQYKIFGINLTIPRIVQMLIGSFNCVLVQKIGTRIFTKKVGMLAGIIAACYPLLIYFDLELLIPSVLLLLILTGFLLIIKQSSNGTRAGWYLTGVVWGLAAITRPNVLLFLLALLVWLIIKMKRKARTALLFGVLGLITVIAPVTIRNYAVSKELVLIAWQGGTNFYIGNNANSDGVTAIIPGTRKSWWGGFYDAKQIAEEALGKKLNNSEIDQYWLQQGIDFIKHNPGKELYLLFRKAYLFFGGLEISNNRDIYFFTKFSYLKFLIWTLPFFQFPFGLLLPCAVVGYWFAFKKKKDISLLLLFILPYSLSFIIFFVCTRFRQAILPFLIILASFAVFSIIEDINSKKKKLYLPGIALFIGTALFFNANIFKLQSTNPALDYCALAGVEYAKGNYRKAIVYLEETLRYSPQYAEALNLMGASYKQLGDTKQAVKYYTMSIHSDPTQPEPYFNLGNIYAQTHDYEHAKELYLKAIELDPHSARAYNNMGNLYFTQRDFAQALEYYEKAGKLEPQYTSPLYHAGLVYIELGNTAKAESLWKRVLEIEPGHEGAQRALRTFIK